MTMRRLFSSAVRPGACCVIIELLVLSIFLIGKRHACLLSCEHDIDGIDGTYILVRNRQRARSALRTCRQVCLPEDLETMETRETLKRCWNPGNRELRVLRRCISGQYLEMLASGLLRKMPRRTENQPNAGHTHRARALHRFENGRHDRLHRCDFMHTVALSLSNVSHFLFLISLR